MFSERYLRLVLGTLETFILVFNKYITCDNDINEVKSAISVLLNMSRDNVKFELAM